MSKEALLETFLLWAKKIFTTAYHDEVKDYLSQSVDYADLDQRIKLLRVRGLF